MNPILLRGIRASAGAVPWYLAGGAPMPVAAYNVREGGSLAGSKINVVNPSANNAAAGVNPTWSGLTGWGMNGVNTYLTTGVIPTVPNWAVLIRYTDYPAVSGGTLFGVLDSSGVTSGRITLQTTGSAMRSTHASNTSFVNNSPHLSSGVYAVAGLQPYRNGVAESGTIASSATNTPDHDIYIGARNENGTPLAFGASNIIYLAIWDTDVDHAAWMPQVSAAVAAL